MTRVYDAYLAFTRYARARVMFNNVIYVCARGETPRFLRRGRRTGKYRWYFGFYRPTCGTESSQPSGKWNTSRVWMFSPTPFAHLDAYLRARGERFRFGCELFLRERERKGTTPLFSNPLRRSVQIEIANKGTSRAAPVRGKGLVLTPYKIFIVQLLGFQVTSALRASWM